MGRPSGLIGAKNTKRAKALRRLKRQAVGGCAFEQINAVTYGIDHRNKRAAGWLMEIAWPGGGRQRWVARVGKRSSEPLSLEAAKAAAVAMLGGHSRPRAAQARADAHLPVNLIGGGRQWSGAVCRDGDLARFIVDTELGGLFND
jgi:hypothetical protein